MQTKSATVLGVFLILATLAGCASKEAWVIVSVRDKLDRSPIAQPVVTVTPRRGDSLLGGKPSAEQSQQANDFGTARMRLATGQVKYNVIVDAPEYDLYTFELPSLDAFFPSGQWLEGDHGRKFPLRPGNEMELMVTLEP